MRTVLRPIAVLLFLTAAAGVTAADNEAEARKIEGLLMAPCCGANTLAMHESPAAQRMRLEIREMLASGMERQQILDHYVGQYGNPILAMPPAHGFNLVVYVLPALVLILGPLLVWKILRRKTPEVVQDTAPGPPIDPAYRKRIENELREFSA